MPTATVSHSVMPAALRIRTGSFMPQLWATTTVPPALIPLKMQVIIHASGVTRDTAATLASPLLLMRAVMSILMNMMDRQSRTLGKVRWRISRHENTVPDRVRVRKLSRNLGTECCFMKKWPPQDFSSKA